VAWTLSNSTRRLSPWESDTTYYRIAIPLTELWPKYAGSPNDGLRIEVFETWLERSVSSMPIISGMEKSASTRSIRDPQRCGRSLRPRC
jgi:hypothetical protein